MFNWTILVFIKEVFCGAPGKEIQTNQTSENILKSDGSFQAGQQGFSANVQPGDSVSWTGEAHFKLNSASTETWQVQLQHEVAMLANTQYTACFAAKAEGARQIEFGVDTGASDYRDLIGGGQLLNLTTAYQNFTHTFLLPKLILRRALCLIWGAARWTCS